MYGNTSMVANKKSHESLVLSDRGGWYRYPYLLPKKSWNATRVFMVSSWIRIRPLWSIWWPLLPICPSALYLSVGPKKQKRGGHVRSSRGFLFNLDFSVEIHLAEETERRFHISTNLIEMDW